MIVVSPGREPQVRARRSVLLSLVAAAALLISVATPASTAAAADVFATSFRGGVALADWTTCPVWRPGAICSETFVVASDAATSERFPGGTVRDAGPRVVLQRFTFEVVDLGGGDLASRPVRESFGGTDAATVEIDRRSRSATVTAAAIPMRTTDFGDGIDRFDEVVALDITWTGAGELQDLDERDMVNDRGRVQIRFTKGWERSAHATAMVDGSPPAGFVVESGTTIVNARQGELAVHR
jgi:hypothetical protein